MPTTSFTRVAALSAGLFLGSAIFYSVSAEKNRGEDYGNELRCVNLIDQSLLGGTISIAVDTPYAFVAFQSGKKGFYLFSTNKVYVYVAKPDKISLHLKVKPDLPQSPFYLEWDGSADAGNAVLRSQEKFPEYEGEYRTMILSAKPIDSVHQNLNAEVMVETRDASAKKLFRTQVRHRAQAGLKKLAVLLKENPGYGSAQGDRLDGFPPDVNFSPIESLTYALRECQQVDDTEVKSAISKNATFKRLKSH